MSPYEISELNILYAFHSSFRQALTYKFFNPPASDINVGCTLEKLGI